MLTSLPNILTLSRIAAIPLLLALIYVDTPLFRWLALGGYVLACVTDYFDGYLARHMKQISPLGRFLDPIADKLLVASLIVMLVATQQIAGLEMIDRKSVVEGKSVSVRVDLGGRSIIKQKKKNKINIKKSK